MKCLIVGCGYVGLSLGAELARLGHEVSGLRRSAIVEDKFKAAGIRPFVGDITRPDGLTGLPRDFDWVVNCVASRGGSAEDYRRLYLEGVRNLVEWLSASPPKKFVYTSSTSVYGQTDGSQVKETSSTEPAAETAKILLETERLLLASWERRHLAGEFRDKCRQDAGAPRQFPAVILRVAGIYGPERGYWFRQFLKGEARIEGDGSRWLNMIHRDDLIGCIITTLKNGRPGEIYNAVDDEPVSQMTFFQWLAEELGRELPPWAPESPEANRKRGATNKRVSNRKLKMELGYQFKYSNFRIGYSAEILRLERAGKLW